MIDIYLSSNKFILQKGDKIYATVLFKDLELTATGPGPDGRRGLSPEECWELDQFLETYRPGQVIKHKSFGEIVLGPSRPFTHEVTLHACGNPDFRQYADLGAKKTVRVVGLEEAVAAVKDYQQHHEMGGGNCARDHGIVWELPTKPGGKRKKVGEVLYNGQYWTLAEKKAFEAELDAKYPRSPAL